MTAMVVTSLPVQAYADELGYEGSDIIAADVVSDSVDTFVDASEEDVFDQVADESIAAEDIIAGDSVDTVSAVEDEAIIGETDEVSVEAEDEEAAPDDEVLSDNELTPDRGGYAPPTPPGYSELPVAYLRAGALESSIMKVDGTLKSGVFGTGVNTQIYTYKVGTKEYRALYIWGDKADTSVKAGTTISGQYYPKVDITTITDIIMDDTIIGIEASEFFGDMTMVSHVRLSSKLKELPMLCFKNCGSIENLTIPNTLEKCGTEMFFKCQALKTITFEDGIVRIPDSFACAGSSDTKLNCSGIERVYIPSSVKEIGKQAFQCQQNLTNVIFKDSENTTLAYIGSLAFFGTYLEGLSLPKFGGTWKDEYNKPHPPMIASRAFAGIENEKFETFVIPEGVVTLDDLWNEGNKWKYIYLPSTLERKSESDLNEWGARAAFIDVFFPAKYVKAIYYAGTEQQFEKKAFGCKMPNEMKFTKQENWYKKMVWNTKPAVVDYVGPSPDKLTITKYYDDLPDTEVIELNVSPIAHIDTEFKAESSDSSIVEATLGAESAGKILLTLKYKKKLGNATVKISCDSATNNISVLIKDKDKAEMPYITGSGDQYGDVYSLNCNTPNAQIFYALTPFTVPWSQITNMSNYTYSAKTDRYTSNNSQIYEYSDPFAVGKDLKPSTFVVHAVVLKPGLKISDEYVKALPWADENIWGDVTVEDQASFSSVSEVPAGLWVAPKQLSDPSLVYTGSPVKIDDLRVYYGKTRLTEKKDYNLTYRFNTNAATAVVKNAPTVDVRLLGGYKGSGSFHFTINPMPLKADSVTFTPASINAKVIKGEYTAQKPDLKIKLDNKLLRAGTDYDADFSSGLLYNPTVAEPGVYSARIHFKGNYTNSGTCVWLDAVTVVGSDTINMDRVVVSPIRPQEIKNKGDEIKPEFTVKYMNKPLKYFSSEFRNNTSAGTGYLILTSYGYAEEDGKKFYGKKIVSFKINGIKLTKQNLTVTDLETGYPYTGSPVDPSALGMKLYYGASMLIKDEDYKVSFNNAH
ncbi:MAG: leucine-rich repeat domain-containing protein, partial [Lachnospiraceae bacterium]|nr:leucine-rich repeat domain-containing protein [Lachnospiraceae bacterium]